MDSTATDGNVQSVPAKKKGILGFLKKKTKPPPTKAEPKKEEEEKF